MKNKFMKILATVAAVVLPFASVSALTESTNYYTYSTGQQVNFYVNQAEEQARGGGGVTGLIMEDKGATDKFVYTFAYSIIGSSSDYSLANKTLVTLMTDKYKITAGTSEEGNDYVQDYQNATMISKDEAIKLFDAKEESATSYTIDVDKQILSQDGSTYITLGSIFQTIGDALSGSAKGKVSGFVTSTEENGKIWAVTFSYTTGAASVTNAKLVQINEDDFDDTYAVMPMLYFNKTADCHEKTVPSLQCYVCTDGSYTWSDGSNVDTNTCKPDTSITTESQCTKHACYDCSGKYTWTEVGKQDSSCKLIPDVTSESKCVVSPKTGVSSHIVEFGIVAAICAAVLLVVKRKDIFKTM